MTPQQLREIANRAIKKSREEQTGDEARKRAEAACKEQMAQAKAKRIIAQIPERAIVEAREGRYHAILMSVDRDERGKDTLIGKHWRCDSTTLTGSAKIVYEHCIDKNFNPTLEFWNDGEGHNSGYNIVIHF